MAETFIIGSGKSLLALSKEEIHHINRASQVISFNKFLLFHEKTGIIPHIHFQSDLFGIPSLYVALSAIERILSDTSLSRTALYFGKVPSMVASAFLPSDRIVDIAIDRDNWKNPDRENWKWAAVPTAPLFHFRGTLTSVINLASCLNPNNTIKLVGVDLSSHEYFFHDEFENNRCLQDWTYSMMKHEGRHSNVIRNNDFNNLSQESAIPWVRTQVESRGGKLLCCNEQSLLVENKLVESASIIAETSPSGKNTETTTETKSPSPSTMKIALIKCIKAMLQLSIRPTSFVINKLPKSPTSEKLRKVV